MAHDARGRRSAEKTGCSGLRRFFMTDAGLFQCSVPLRIWACSSESSRLKNSPQPAVDTVSRVPSLLLQIEKASAGLIESTMEAVFVEVLWPRSPDVLKHW